MKPPSFNDHTITNTSADHLGPLQNTGTGIRCDIDYAGAIPTVPKKVEVACPFHSRKYCGVPSSLKKGCHQMLYNLIVYISAPCTLQHNKL